MPWIRGLTAMPERALFLAATESGKERTAIPD